ncbi:MAG: hypothetical protein K8R36_18500 [Planctomycetales bacterium]|nr:hypothetical protein [Planctomycetales bacterium]
MSGEPHQSKADPERCPKCDGRGQIDAPPDEDGDDRPAICPVCHGSGKKPAQEKK